MEGDLKDVVLSRLERRLKDKDGEIHALKERVMQAEAADQATVTRLAERLDKVEVDVHGTQIVLSEVMKKVGSLEATMDFLLTSMNAGDEEPSEVPTDMSLPGAPQMNAGFGDYAASLPDQKDIEDGDGSKGDKGEHEESGALRFFQSKNS